jgi:hypothetical protein
MSGVYALGSEVVSESYPPNPLSAAAYVLMRGASTNAQFLIDIFAYRGGVATSGGLETISEIPLADFPAGSDVAVGSFTLRYADRDWVGSLDDTMYPNTFYEGRVSMPFMLDAQAPLYPEEDRRVQRQFGAVEIINSDAALDDIIQSYAVDGRQVQVRFGPYMGDYSDFAIIADMVATGWQPGEEIVRLPLRDNAYSLDLPLQNNLYEGTGDEEGTAELSGKPKPLCYGQVQNITPVFLVPLHLIYQVHDGRISAVSTVYDRASALTLDTAVGTGGDCADYASLVAASVGASKFATCLALGLFKLGSSPAGVITADVLGDATGGVYRDTIDGITLRILYDRADVDPLVVDEGTIIGTASIGGPVGFYVSQNEPISSSQAISSLFGSIGAWWGASIDGKLRAGRLLNPGTTEPTVFLDEYDIVSVEAETKPIPRWRQRVSYAPNWTVQRGEDLNAAVTDARKQYLAEPYSVVTQADATIQIRHVVAGDPVTVPTLLRDESDAQVIADYLHELHGVERQIFRIVTKYAGLEIDLGDCINLSYPRFGLGGGVNFIVIGRSVDAGRGTVELRIWG